MDNYTPPGSNLRMLMAQKKLKIADLHRLTKVSRPVISALQDEIPIGMTFRMLSRVAKPFGLQWYDLIKWQDNPPQLPLCSVGD